MSAIHTETKKYMEILASRYYRTSILYLPNDVLQTLIFSLLSKISLLFCSLVCSSFRRHYIAVTKHLVPLSKSDMMKQLFLCGSVAQINWFRTFLKYPMMDIRILREYLPFAAEGKGQLNSCHCNFSNSFSRRKFGCFEVCYRHSRQAEH